jgi:2-polyprenyl-3-methyl-5-hydroxy-6-metoxy-1,4-benzoquinol methylase
MRKAININQEYWDASYQNFDFYEEADSLTQWIHQHYLDTDAPELKGKSVFEIGCFPGRYLIHFGKKGMVVNGLDQTPHLQKLPEWLSTKGVRCGNFYQESIFRFERPTRYDLVCSFGFIEHFDNYKEVIEKHIELNADHGSIIITTPNFRGGFQFLMHRLFDKPNLGRHNTKAMNPETWASVLEDAGYRIVHKGYFGRYDLWFDSDVPTPLHYVRKRYMRYMHPWLAKCIRFDSPFFSPYCGVVATKAK